MTKRRAARTAALVALLMALCGLSAIAGQPYHGNARSKVFHSPSCRYYDCDNCYVELSSVKEALRQGFRPCGICRPSDVSAASTRSTRDAAAHYVGNSRSRVFHRIDCRYASCANCNVAFATRDDAINRGYRPGGCCNP